MPPGARASPLNAIDLPALALDHSAQLIVLSMLDHVGQDRQHAAGTAVEGIVREDQVPLVQAFVREGLLVDFPEPTQRECGHINSAGACSRGGLALSERTSGAARQRLTGGLYKPACNDVVSHALNVADRIGCGVL